MDIFLHTLKRIRSRSKFFTLELMYGSLQITEKWLYRKSLIFANNNDFD